MRDGLTSKQLYAALLAAMSAPLTLIAARLQWCNVAAALLPAAVYYYIMYRLRRDQPLAERTLAVFGTAGRWLLWVTAAWLVWLTGFLAAKSTLVFPQTAEQPLTGLLLLLPAAWTARKGIRAAVRCGTVLLLFLTVLYAVVLVFSAPRVKLYRLSPSADGKQMLLFFGLLMLPSVGFFFRTEEKNAHAAPWYAAGGILALAASAITAGCLSQKVAAAPMSFYLLSKSVSLFGTMERFEALVSAAALSGYFCLLTLLLCAVREIVFSLLPQCREKKLLVLPAAIAATVVSASLPTWIFGLGAAIFCGVFPLITLLIGAVKKV